MNTRLLYFSLLLFCWGMAPVALGQMMIQEQVKLHTDRQVYMSGDNILIKAYVTDALLGKPSTLSRVLRIELWDARGTLHTRAKMLLEDGMGTTNLAIPQNQNSGYYQIRAYTRWMANGASSGYYHQKLIILNPDQPLPVLAEEVPDSRLTSNIHLFPEGGQLVNELPSRVGIIVTDELGRKKESLGRIELTDGTVVGAFQTRADGQAMFDFTPISEQRYFIRLLENADTNQLFSIPQALDTGLVMMAEMTESRMLNITADSRGIKPGKISVKLSKGGLSFESGLTSTEAGKWKGTFPCTNLPSGEWLTELVSGSGTVLARRKVWVPGARKLQLSVDISSRNFGPRKEVIVDIQSRDQQGRPLPAHLSLAATKKLGLEGNHGLAGGDGLVPDDLSMLNQFLPVPQNQAQDKEVMLPELYGVMVSGKVADRIGNPVSQAKVLLSFPGKTAFVRTRRTDEEGNFSFLLEDIFGVREICLLAISDEGNLLNIQLDKDIWGDIPYPSPFSLAFSKQEASALQELLSDYQLSHAYSNPGQEFTASFPELDNFFQTPDKAYVLDDYTRFDTEETFHEIIYSVTLRRRNGQFFFRVYDSYQDILLDRDPLILVDGIPVSNAGTVIGINSKLLERVEVVSTLYHQDDIVWDGVVHAITYKGDASAIRLPASYQREPYVFLTPAYGSQSKKYSSEESPDKHFPDLRSVLHWNPGIQTDLTGHVQLRFFTSDVYGTFEVKVSGISENGLAGEAQAEFIVSDKSR